MAGIDEPTMIDVMATDRDGSCLLAMVEDRPWGTDPAQPMQLREKVNRYVEFVLSGDLVQRFPEMQGKPVRFLLNCADAPTAEIETIITVTRVELEKLGISFRLKVRQ